MKPVALKHAYLTPLEAALEEGRIDYRHLDTSDRHKKKMTLVINSSSENDIELRCARIEKEWGSVSNFMSAMLWYFTSGYVHPTDLQNIRSAWNASHVADNFKELSEQQVKQAVQLHELSGDQSSEESGSALTLSDLDELREHMRQRGKI